MIHPSAGPRITGGEGRNSEEPDHERKPSMKHTQESLELEIDEIIRRKLAAGETTVRELCQHAPAMEAAVVEELLTAHADDPDFTELARHFLAERLVGALFAIPLHPWEEPTAPPAPARLRVVDSAS
jgi:hypothetical protein